MPRVLVFFLYFVAIFLQAGAYGLTCMLARLFASFGANEKVVGAMLMVTTIATLITVYFSGHLSDLFGRLRTLWRACITISESLFLYGSVDTVRVYLVIASLLLGFGWGLAYRRATWPIERRPRVDRLRWQTCPQSCKGFPRQVARDDFARGWSDLPC